MVYDNKKGVKIEECNLALNAAMEVMKEKCGLDWTTIASIKEKLSNQLADEIDQIKEYERLVERLNKEFQPVKGMKAGQILSEIMTLINSEILADKRRHKEKLEGQIYRLQGMLKEYAEQEGRTE